MQNITIDAAVFTSQLVLVFYLRILDLAIIGWWL